MSENASLKPSEAEEVVARAARRALSRREQVYTDEVRRLLDAGQSVMVQAGTASSPRVADIVRAAGLSNDAFYRHFASKEDLVSAIVAAGAHRLASYLSYHMDKEDAAEAKLRRWVEGILAQAGDPEVAEATRCVLWNGGRVGDQGRGDAPSTYEPLAALLTEPLSALGSSDTARDALAICHAVMGRMEDFLWSRVAPTAVDVDHLVAFCRRAVAPA